MYNAWGKIEAHGSPIGYPDTVVLLAHVSPMGLCIALGLF